MQMTAPVYAFSDEIMLVLKTLHYLRCVYFKNINVLSGSQTVQSFVIEKVRLLILWGWTTTEMWKSLVIHKAALGTVHL